MRISQGNNLLRVGRVGKDFLVTGDRLLNTTSPTEIPSAPMAVPRKILPSSRTSSAGFFCKPCRESPVVKSTSSGMVGSAHFPHAQTFCRPRETIAQHGYVSAYVKQGKKSE